MDGAARLGRLSGQRRARKNRNVSPGTRNIVSTLISRMTHQLKLSPSLSLSLSGVALFQERTQKRNKARTSSVARPAQANMQPANSRQVCQCPTGTACSHPLSARSTHVAEQTESFAKRLTLFAQTRFRPAKRGLYFVKGNKQGRIRHCRSYPPATAIERRTPPLPVWRSINLTLTLTGFESQEVSCTGLRFETGEVEQ
jgi:hypothetical protein